MKPIKIRSDVSIILPRKNKPNRLIRLNYNVCRNLHGKTLGKVKKIYSELFADLKGLKLKTPLCIEYELIAGNKIRRDSANVYVIIDKFFCDVLVKMECIKDDDDKHIKSKILQPHIYSKDENYCNIFIYQNKDRLLLNRE